MKKFALFCSVLMSISVLFTACPPVTETGVASIEVKPAEVSMKNNEVRRLSTVAKDKDGNVVDATMYEVDWTSSNEEVATVSENGTVTALAQGTAVITATVKNSNVSATSNVKVTDLVEYTIFDNASSVGYNPSEFYEPYDWTDNEGTLHQDSLVRMKFYVFNQDMYLDAINGTLVGDGGYGMFFETNNILSPKQNTIYSLGEYAITENPAMKDTLGKQYPKPHQIVCGHFDTDAWTEFFTQALDETTPAPSWNDYPLYPDGELEFMMWFPSEDGSDMTYMNCGYVYGEGVFVVMAEEGSKITDPLTVPLYEFNAKIIDVLNAYGFETRPGNPELNPEESADEEYFVVPLTMKPMREHTFTYDDGSYNPNEAPAKPMSLDRMQSQSDFIKTLNVVNVDKLNNYRFKYNK